MFHTYVPPLTVQRYYSVLHFKDSFKGNPPYDKNLLQDVCELLEVFIAMIAHHKQIQSMDDTVESIDYYQECIVCHRYLGHRFYLHERYIWNTTTVCIRPCKNRKEEEEYYVCSYCEVPAKAKRVACVSSIQAAEQLCEELIQTLGIHLTDIPYVQ